MKLKVWVTMSLALSVACQQPAASGKTGEITGNPNTLVKNLIAENLELRSAHWELKGSMGIVVAKKHDRDIDDRAKRLLQNEIEQIFENYHFASMNLCKTEKPSAEWSDEEWSDFRQAPVARLNTAIGATIIEDIYCEEMVFTEYQIVLTNTPVPGQ